MSSSMSGPEWAVVIGIFAFCVAVSVLLVRMTKKPGKHAADPRAQRNLAASVQRDKAWKPRPNQANNPWRSQPQTATRKLDPSLGPVGIAVGTQGDTPSNDSCAGGTE